MKKITINHTPQTVEDGGARYDCDSHGDWIGWLGVRRTMLKSSLTAAKDDVHAQRFVCACWPNCRHQGPK